MRIGALDNLRSIVIFLDIPNSRLLIFIRIVVQLSLTGIVFQAASFSAASFGLLFFSYLNLCVFKEYNVVG